MPSSVSWLVMGGPTAHSTGVTLASDDPPNSLNMHEGSFGRHFPWEAVPRPVLWEGRERYRALVGAASVGGLSEPGSATQSVPLLHIKSSEEVAYPAAGEVAENMGLLLGSRGRGGERVRKRRLSGSQRRRLSERRRVSGGHSVAARAVVGVAAA